MFSPLPFPTPPAPGTTTARAPVATSTPTPTPTPTAPLDPFYRLTQTDWATRTAEALANHAILSILVIVVAVALRFLVHRGIGRLTKEAVDGRVPTLLRPLRDRAAASLRDVAPHILERRSQRAQAIGSVLRSFSTMLIFGVAFVMILGAFGVNLAPIIASAGILGVAIGFGAQNLVRDFLSGIFMMLEDQYGVGDVVDLGEASGTVEAVGLRITTLRDIAGTVWYVRNGEVLRVGNSSQGFSVAVIDIPVGYSADVDAALDVATCAAGTACEDPKIAPKVLAVPEMLGVQSVTVEGVLMRLTVRTRPGQQWAVQRAVVAEVKTALETAGVPAPVPGGRPTATGRTSHTSSPGSGTTA